MRVGIVYTLDCPVTGMPKYIGQTIMDPKHRLDCHLCDIKQKNKKSNWIKSLKFRNLIPTMTIIDNNIPQEFLNFWEMHYISLYKSWGFQLKNGTDGGAGLRRAGGHTEETKRKISQAQIGKFVSEETRKKQSLARIGKVAPMKGRKKTPEQIEATAAIHRGKPLSREHREKIATAMKGKPAKNKGIPMSKEAKVKARISTLRKRIKKRLQLI